MSQAPAFIEDDKLPLDVVRKTYSDSRHALCCLECGFESSFDPRMQGAIGPCSRFINTNARKMRSRPTKREQALRLDARAGIGKKRGSSAYNPKLSFTATAISCSDPRYLSVV